MSSDSELCPDCRTPFEMADNYCRQCGMYLVALRPAVPVPTETTSRALEPVRPGLPAPVRRAATALAIGTALQIGVGLAGRYLASQAARQAANAATNAAVTGSRRKPARRQTPAVEPAPETTTAVSETVIIRRVWMRRG
jgi:hypothetical protein